MRGVILRAGALGAVVGGGFYLLLIDTTSLPELYGLAGVAAACAVAVVLALEQRFVAVQLRLRWLPRAWRLLVRIPADTAILCFEAVAQLVRPRPVRGEFRACRFAATGDAPEATGRRAVAETLGSVAPNTIIVGADPERGLLLVHQLRRQGRPQDLDATRLG